MSNLAIVFTRLDTEDDVTSLNVECEEIYNVSYSYIKCQYLAN